MAKKIKISITVIVICFGLFSCASTSSFITTQNGEKQYKDADGNIIRNEWVEIGKGKYFFDLNGFLLTNQWVENEYYVDENGKMKVKEWYDDIKNHNKYYLGSDGKYIRDTLITINGKDYYFNKDGTLKVNEIFESNIEDEYGTKKLMYADENGVVRKVKGIIKIKNDNYYIDSDGYIFNDGWKEIDNEWYYFDSQGKMKHNEWFEATYYFDANGKMLKNTTSPEGYEIDKDGKVLEQYRKNLLAKDFAYIYKEYCKFPWAEVGSDGSYLSIDTNPYDIDDRYSGSYEYFNDAWNAVKTINKILGFPEYIVKKIGETTTLDGKQSEVVDNIELTWKYHPDKGAEIMYIIKNSKGE